MRKSLAVRNGTELSSKGNRKKVCSNRSLHFLVASVSIPHPKKLHKHGEDAHFVHHHTIGVFDGVGSWSSRGVDPGRYSKKLAELTGKAYRRDGKHSAKDALTYAVSRNHHKGSSTACVMDIKGRHLRGINVGDSGMVVVRNGAIVYSTEERSHNFNYPYQVSYSQPEDLKQGERINFILKVDDVIVTATDGLWDNVFKRKIVEKVVKHADRWRRVDESHHEVSESRSASHRFEGSVLWRKISQNGGTFRGAQKGKRLEELALDISSHACETAHRRGGPSPFSEKSRKVGKSYSGGKLDDITVVVASVTSSREHYVVSLECVCPGSKK